MRPIIILPIPASFFYGDDDIEDRLRILDEYLSEFDLLGVDSRVPLQEPFAEPKQFVYPYSVEEGEEADNKAMVDINLDAARIGRYGVGVEPEHFVVCAGWHASFTAA